MNEQETRQLIIVIREEIAELLRQVNNPMRELLGMNFVNWEEDAQRKAKSIAMFYKELLNSGIDKEIALEMTRSIFINPSDIMKEYLIKEMDVIKEIILCAISGNRQT